MVKPTQVIHTVAALQTLIAEHRASGSSIGFVPTMGALHDGHLTFMQASKAANDITVCSIYVNPTQFDNKEDLAKYPKILDKDTDLLNTIGVDYTFAPSDSEVYPNGMGETITVDLGGLDTRLEGEHRPGHFAGVVQVVHRLLDIVKPDNLYMGQKDFQQFTIIQRMLDQLAMPVNLVVCPISRDPSGLARSSRNARLSELDKARACFLNQTLEELRADIKVYSIDALLRRATDRLTWSWTKLEYISIVDGHTLQHVHNIKNHKYVVAVLAVWIGGVRLIDNCTLLAD